LLRACAKITGMSKIKQQITPELRQWIIAQAQAGHQPEAVLTSMKSSGWDEETAIEAMESTLSGFLDEHAKKNQLPPPVPVPEPAVADSPSIVDAGDRHVHILTSMRTPRVLVFGNLLSDQECEQLIELARPRMERSQTVVNATGDSEVNEARTSKGMFFQRGEGELCTRIEARLGRLLGWPVENGEGLQILQYAPGAEYKPHYDYFDPAHSGTPKILTRGGQRVATIVMYLNTPTKGGGTTFPDVGLEVAAQRGNAVFFSYDRAHPSTKTLHGGAPVIEGEKWVATKWLRQGRFD
jgi:prolyl 4-hydroxylase